jgi:hypothetical protein
LAAQPAALTVLVSLIGVVVIGTVVTKKNEGRGFENVQYLLKIPDIFLKKNV